MHKFSYNRFHELENSTIILSTKYHKHLGNLSNVDLNSPEFNFNMASAQEISFDVYKYLDDKEEKLWDSIVDFKYIFVPEHQEYYSIEVTIDENDSTVKHVVGKSSCEFELSGRKLYNFECNTESDILQDDYVVTTFYNPDNIKGSLLHRVLADKCPDYTIGHVDNSLWYIQRTFSADGQDIYSFFVNTVAEEIECLFVFDSVNRVINVYDLKFVCDSCGHRGDLAATCPECGSHEYHSKYGETTNIFISAENYAEQISCSGDVDNVFNCLKISGGDDIINTALMYINPNGSQYIYNFNAETLADMPEELVTKIIQYNELYESLKESYAQESTRYFNAVDQKGYLEHSMMPEVTTPTTDAQSEADTLPGKFSEFGDISVTNITNLSSTSANLAVQGMAKVLTDSRYEIKVTGTVSDLISGTYRNWTGTATITNMGNDEDTATTSSFSVKIVGNNYEGYLYQRILKQLDRDDSIFFTIFEIQDIDTFKEQLTKYSKSRLESFYQSYETCLNVLIENGVANQNSTFYDVDLYNNMYTPYKNRLDAIQAEIAVRDAEIEEQNEIITESRNNINAYHGQLDFKSFIGDELWVVYSHYRRESTYSNDNYISDGLDNGEVIEKAKELFEVCEKEVYKASQLQYSLTASLNNLLNTKEFAPYKDKISIGNWITMKIDEKLYYLRLVNIQISHSSLDKITLSFSDTVKVNNTINDAQSILSQAKSMASSYDTVKHQASQGDNANTNIMEWIQNGLNSALVSIKNNNNEEITYDKNGLLARSYDDILDMYDPKQFKITHNAMAFTTDNWLTVKAVMGESQYAKYDAALDRLTTDNQGYGVLAEYLNAAYITGSQIVGGDIYSFNYSKANKTGTALHLNDGTFSYAGGKLEYDGTDLNYTGNLIMTGGNLIVRDTSSNILFKADVDNRVVNIGGFTVNNKAIYSGTNSNTSTTAGVYIGTDGIRNYKDSTHYVDIKNGVLTANSVSVSGTITGSSISGGTISGSSISAGTISGTEINNGNGTFKVDTSGNVTANSLTSNNATITGGTISIKTASQSNDIFSLGYMGNVYYRSIIRPGFIAIQGFNNEQMTTQKANITMDLMDNADTALLSVTNTSGHVVSIMPGIIHCSAGNTDFSFGSGQFTIQKANISFRDCPIEIYHTTPYIDFHFGNSTTDYTARIIETSSGNLLAYNTISNASDKRLKKDIAALDNKYLQLFDMISPKQYRFKKGDEYLNLGFIAQEIDDAMNEIGIDDKPLIIQPTDNNKYYALDYNGLIALLWNKCKDLQNQINKMNGDNNG